MSVSVMILQPSQDVAGMAGLGWGKQEDTGDMAGVGGVVTHPFHYKGASFLRVQTVHGRRNEGEVEREEEKLLKVMEMSAHQQRRELLGRHPGPAGWAPF